MDVQQWLRQENRKAVKVRIIDLKIDKTKERGQIRSINYDDVARKVTGYQALPAPGPLRVTAWEDSVMTRFAFDGRHFFSLQIAHFTFSMVNMAQKHAERFRNCVSQKAKNWRTGRSFATLLRSEVQNALEDPFQGCRIATSWQPVCDMDSAV